MLERLPGVADVQLFGERAHVRLEPGSPLSDPERLSAALRSAGVPVESVRRVPPSLEDVFIARVCEGNDMKRVMVFVIHRLRSSHGT